LPPGPATDFADMMCIYAMRFRFENAVWKRKRKVKSRSRDLKTNAIMTRPKTISVRGSLKCDPDFKALELSSAFGSWDKGSFLPQVSKIVNNDKNKRESRKVQTVRPY
jgi:hypothetical protein